MKHFHHTTLFFKHKIFSASVFNESLWWLKLTNLGKLSKFVYLQDLIVDAGWRMKVTGHEDDYKRKLAGTIDSLLHDFPHGLERYRISQVLHG